ncbi:uncharacterized protein LOC135847659 isoform X2 [Planococcus citri]|uniref:uncharacterized protein LOC135847659 isoform X2 n=1 Tax=Planococcus citri TaxID=170843 RepID=UPI0031F8FE71
MGKKTKKTKWRTLEISLPVSGKNYHENGANLQLDDGWRASYSYDKYRRNAAGYDKIVKTSACDAKNSSVEQNHAKAQIEDEYTKITTPRQDVLFKKGYLTRRKTWRHTCDENAADSFASNETAVNLGDIQAQADYASHNGDEEFCDYASMTTDGGSRLPSLSPVQPQSHSHSHSQQLLCATSQPYIDASAAAAATATALYYGGGYEIYDPYTGSVTALVVGATPTASSAAASAAAASCQPLLTSMPCRPVPLHSLQWFNPVPSSNEWCCDANAASSYAAIVDDADADAGDGDSAAKASHSGDSTNANTSASESSSVAENTTPTTGAGGDVAAYSPHPPHPAHPSESYIYPSYVFGTAAVYSIEDDGTNVRYCSPESSIFNGNESATTKRKKRRKRRRRFGETEDDSESGVEENHDEYVFSCENQVVDYAHDELAATVHVHVQNQSNYSPFGSQNALHGHGGRHCTSFPHASINAPPFVPANCGGGGGGGDDDLSCCRSNDKYVDKVENKSAAAVAASINAVDSKVRRETFVDGENQSPTDSPSSSNNSDSGISSPGIEDCPSIGGQDHDFRKSVQADRSKTSFNNNLATSPVMRSGDGGKTTSGAAAAAAAVIPAAVAAAAAAGDAPAATLSPDDKAKICDSSYASAEAKCGLDDKPLKKIRAKNTSSRVKRCHSKNEERYRRRSVSERDGATATAAAAASLDLGATDRRVDDESVDCAQSVAVCDQQPPSATENRSKKSTIIIETTPRIERVERVAVADENSTKCSSSANEERSSPNEKNRRRYESENGRVIDTISDVVDGNEPQAAENDASHLHGDPFENQIANCDQTDAYAVDPNDAALSASSLSRAVPQQSTCWPKANVNVDVDVDASERAAPQDGSVNQDSQSRHSSERVALAARILVDEIVQRAESQIRMSTTKCDKLQLPLTQAVTNWLNERGGLPAAAAAAVDGFEIKNHRRLFSTQPPSDESLDDETTVSRLSQSKETVDKSKTSSSNCVIC